MVGSDLHRRIKSLSKTTPSQARIVEYFLSGEAKIAYESATAIAQKTGLSKSTVVRFIARLGYDTFDEFQEQARQEMENHLVSPIQRFRLTKHRFDDTGDDLLGRNITKIIKNLHETHARIKPDRFKEICRMLAENPGGIFFTGPRTSHALAYMLWILIGYLRDRVHLLDSHGSSLALQMMGLSRDDLLFAVFRRPYARQTIQTARYFAKLGATIVLLTDSEINPLNHLTDWQIVVPFSEGLSVFGSACAAVAVIESLVLAVEHLRGGEVRERFERADQLFQIFSEYDHPLAWSRRPKG